MVLIKVAYFLVVSVNSLLYETVFYSQMAKKCLKMDMSLNFDAIIFV